MKIILSNGTELDPMIVTGAFEYVHGINRDALTFVFNDSHDMEDLDRTFTDAACESINIIGDDGSEAIHTGYTIRTKLMKKAVEVEKATEEKEAVYENRIFVTMAQRSYTESQMAEMQNAMMALAGVEV